MPRAFIQVHYSLINQINSLMKDTNISVLHQGTVLGCIPYVTGPEKTGLIYIKHTYYGAYLSFYTLYFNC